MFRRRVAVVLCVHQLLVAAVGGGGFAPAAAGETVLSTGGALCLSTTSHNTNKWSDSWSAPAGRTILRARFRGNSESGFDYGYLYCWGGSSWVLASQKSGSYDSWVTLPDGVTQIRTRLTTDGSVLWSPTFVDVPEVVVASPPFVPGKPVLATGATVQWQQRVTWAANGNPAGTVYELWRKTLDASGAVVGDAVIYSGSDLSFTTVDQVAGRYYLYRVRAGWAGEWSAFSAETAYWTVPVPSVTAVAGGLEASWPGVMSGLSYRVYRRPEGGSWSLLATTAALSHSQAGLNPTVRYETALEPVLPEGGTVWRSPGALRAPLAFAPGSVSVSAGSASTVAVAWAAGGNPSGVEYSAVLQNMPPVVPAYDAGFELAYGRFEAAGTFALGGNWQAVPAQAGGSPGAIEVFPAGGVAGPKFVRIHDAPPHSWKAVVGAAVTLRPGAWYRVSLYARSEQARGAQAYAFYAWGDARVRHMLIWETGSLGPGKGWVRRWVVFRVPADYAGSGAPYLYGHLLNNGGASHVDYDGYLIEEFDAEPSGEPPVPVVVVSPWGAVLSHTFSGLAPGACYEIGVRARNADGVETAHVRAAGRTAPARVEDFAAGSGALAWSNTAGRGWVTLEWDPVSEADGYRVWVFDGNQHRALDMAGSGQLVGDNSFEARSGGPALKNSAVWSQTWSKHGAWSACIGGTGYADWSGLTWTVPVSKNREYIICGYFRNTASNRAIPVNLFGTNLGSGGAGAVSVGPGASGAVLWRWNSGNNTSASLRLETWGSSGADGYLYVDLLGMWLLSPGFSVDTATGRVRWDSREARVYPPEATLDGYGDNTVTADLFRRDGSGLDLRDTPQKLYRKTAGTEYDARHNYWFCASAYNESGDSGRCAAGCYLPLLPNRTDTQAPTGSVLVDDGRMIAGTPSVVLSLSASDPAQSNHTSDVADDASGVAQMRFSNDGSKWSDWVPFAETYAWTLDASAFGKKTVSVQFRDAAGNVSATVTDDIYYYLVDMQAPSVALVINGGAAQTSSPVVQLEVKAQDDVTPATGLVMRFSTDFGSWTSWGSYVPYTAFTLPSGDGLKTVYVQVKDASGNVGTAHGAIALVTSGSGIIEAPGVVSSPSGKAGTAWISGQAVQVRFVTGSQVQVSLNAPGAAWVQFSLDNLRWLPAEPVVPQKTISLPDWEGHKTVYVKLSDGNVYLVRFVLDRTAPVVEASWLGGASVARGGVATMVLNANDNFSRQENLEYSLDGGVTWKPYAFLVDVPVGGSGYRTVRVLVRDQAGNVAAKVLGIFSNP